MMSLLKRLFRPFYRRADRFRARFSNGGQTAKAKAKQPSTAPATPTEAAPPKKDRVLVIHAGTGKTGSTSIQAALAQYEEQLSAQGIHVIRSTRRVSYKAKHYIDWTNQNDDNWELLRDEVESLKDIDHHMVVMSQEGAYSSGRRGLKNLREVFSDYEIRTVMYVRDQADFAQSLTLQRIKTGRERVDIRNAEQAAEAIRRRKTDYLTAARNHHAIFDDVEVRVFDRSTLHRGDAAADFFKVIGADDIADTAEPMASNPSITAGFAAVFYDLDQEEPGWRKDRTTYRAALELSTEGNGPRYFLTKSEVAELRDRHQAGNEQLLENFVTNATELPQRDAWLDEPIDTAHYRELLAARIASPIDTETGEPRPKRDKTLVLHAGTAEAGATDIQDALTRHQAALGEAGIHVLRSNRPGSGKAKTNLRWTDDDDPSWDRLREELESLSDVEHHTIVMSQESAYSTGRKGLKRLREMFDDYDIRVVMYVRDQAELAQSLVLQRVRTGREHLDVCNRDHAVAAIQHLKLDYLSAARNHSKVFEEVEIRVFDEELLAGGSAATDFFHLIGAESIAASIEASAGAPSISAGFAALFYELDEEGASWRDNRATYRAAIELSTEGHGPSYFLTQDEVEELRERHRASNEQLVTELVTNATEIPQHNAWIDEPIDTDHFRTLLMERAPK